MKRFLPLLLLACAHAPAPTMDMVKLDDCAKAIRGLESRYELPRDEPVVPHVGVYKASWLYPVNTPKVLLASSGVDVRGPGSASSSPTFGNAKFVQSMCVQRTAGSDFGCVTGAVDSNWIYLTSSPGGVGGTGWRINGATTGTSLYIDNGNIVLAATGTGIRSGSQNARVTFTASDGIDFSTTNGAVQWSIVPGTGNLDGTAQQRSVLAQSVFLFQAQGTAGSGTGYTTNATAQVAHQVHKITVARTALTAAATTEDETIWTIPAKTRVLRIIVEVTAAFDDGAGPISAVTVQCGPSAGSTAYVTAQSVFATGIIGDAAAEIGAGLLSATYADIPSYSGTTAISCRFTSTGGNLSTLTTGSATFYIEHLVFP